MSAIDLGATTHSAHRPVLLFEAAGALRILADGTYLDATFGGGGHSAAILRRLGPQGRLLALDRDPASARIARERFGADPRFEFRHERFSAIGTLTGLRGRVSGVLMDVGVSSLQMDDPGRGFSMLRDGPLDMRMDPERGQTAAQWLAAASEDEISTVLRQFGEERFHRRIARAICAARERAPIDTTARLARVIAGAVPRHEPGRHPATRSFQAIRIAINGELDELAAALAAVPALLHRGGRLVVISFHSLEDRLVKRFMRDRQRGDLPPELPVPAADTGATLRPIGRAVRPGAAEVAANPRSRSAVMRVAERL